MRLGLSLLFVAVATHFSWLRIGFADAVQYSNKVPATCGVYASTNVKRSVGLYASQLTAYRTR